MPFCPDCKTEYKAGITACPDCGSPLVDLLPRDEEGKHYDNWVQIARLSSHEMAEMVAEVWEDNEIPHIIQSGTGHFGMTGQMGFTAFRPVGGFYSLYVPEEFVAEADAEAQIVLGEDWLKSRLVDIEEESE